MLEVTAGGGGTCPCAPLWILPWACGFHVKELSGMRVTLFTLFICLQYHSATSSTSFALNLAVNFWLKLSLSTFDWNIRYQLLIVTFGVEIWLKLLIAFRCQLLIAFRCQLLIAFRCQLLIAIRCQLLIAIRCQLLITTELSNLRQHFWIQTDSCRRFDLKVAV